MNSRARRSDILKKAGTALACAAILAACNRTVKPGASPAPASMAADVQAFVTRPNDATFEAVHADILKGRLTGVDEMRIVDRVAAGSVPARIRNAVMADIASVDFLGEMGLLRQINTTSRAALDPSSLALVRRSARLCWLLLELRPFEDSSQISLEHMDLRASEPFVGQAMNLKNVNFSGAILPGGTWTRSDLTGAIFRDATADGTLTCENCTWGESVRATLRFANGEWTR
jgi:uncharacterized protein YjbI with pentapeptide repeats